MAVTLAGDLSDLVWDDLEDRFRHAAGRPPLEVIANHSRPRLTIIDTAADRDDSVGNGVGGFDHTGNSPHGYSLARMAKDLLCTTEDGEAPENDQGCVAEISTRLALSYLDFDAADPDASPRDFQNGGFVGTISELAETIQRAVDETGRDSDGRPILNLSVAWHPRFGGAFETPTEMPPAVLAVYRALQHASCRGAIAVAAAGNDSGGPGEDAGPLLPGGWERRPAPRLDECSALLDPQVPNEEDFADSESYHPLVWAVGGVDHAGAILSNARDEGMPPMVAYGAQGVVAGHDPSIPTATLTGSSVSSLVVAATAAAVVHIAPTLPPTEVMKLVWASGVDLGVPPARFLSRRRERHCLRPERFAASDPADGQGVPRRGPRLRPLWMLGPRALLPEGHRPDSDHGQLLLLRQLGAPGDGHGVAVSADHGLRLVRSLRRPEQWTAAGAPLSAASVPRPPGHALDGASARAWCLARTAR